MCYTECAISKECVRLFLQNDQRSESPAAIIEQQNREFAESLKVDQRKVV